MSAATGPELVIARHGHAHCNTTHTLAGPSCTGLTDAGRAQAQALAARLRREGGVTQIHASTTRRAQETAALIADVLGIPVQEQHQLRVPDPGGAEGQPWKLARATYPIDPENPVRPLAPGGETWTSYLARAVDALAALLDGPPDGRILVVGHSETATAAFTLFLGTHSLGQMKITLDYAGVTRWQPVTEYPGVTVTAPRWALTAHNDTHHLSVGPARPD